MSAETVDQGTLPVRLVLALLAIILGTTALVVGLTAGDDEPELPSDAVRRGDIAVYGAYMREPVTENAAAYFSMTNVGDTADTLIAVSSPVAAAASMHDVGKKAPDGSGGIDSGSMVPTPSVQLKAGQTITLEPAGGHLMLEKVSGSLQPGAIVNLRLVFETAGTIAVKAPVIALTDPAPTS